MPTETAIPADDVKAATSVFTDLYHQLPTIFMRLLLAGVAIIAGILILKLLRRLITKYLRRKKDTRGESVRQEETVRSLSVSVVNYLMYFLIAMIVLRIFGIDLTSILAVAGIGSIAIGFGAQTLIKDIISGMFLWFEGNLNVGDVVTLAGYTGTVESISLRTTALRGTDGRLYSIPNGDVRTVICRSRGQQVAQVNVTIAHGQDLYRAKEVIEDECRQLAERLSLDSVPVVYPAIANDARCVTMRVEYPCDVNRDWPLEREIRLSVYDRLRREDIKP
ncbi:MAG: mechanosensitive ion channel family protein [Clostridia bacterium]|jgi:Small-conductance mechanosensitive channel|nr:mechanosensitive ion channel family protein [Clostridia bacterium]